MNRLLENYIDNIMGRTFIKSAAQIDNSVFIFFYNSYQEYLHDKDTTKVTEEDFHEYFSKGTVEKILVGEPARILREFHFIDTVEIKLPLGSLLYTVIINRESLDEHLGFKIESTSVYDDSWRKLFSDVYIYNKAYREEFINKFATLTNNP